MFMQMNCVLADVYVQFKTHKNGWSLVKRWCTWCFCCCNKIQKYIKNLKKKIIIIYNKKIEEKENKEKKKKTNLNKRWRACIQHITHTYIYIHNICISYLYICFSCPNVRPFYGLSVCLTDKLQVDGWLLVNLDQYIAFSVICIEMFGCM